MLNPVEQSKAPTTRPALKLVKTTDMSREEWLDVRKQGIGSSDAAAAVGLNPYKSQLELWMEKTGQDALLPKIDANDESTNVYWGTLLEPIVAAHYTKRTGNKVRRINAVLQHPSEPWMLANIDREIVGADGVQILECKTAGLHGSRLWDDGVPEYVQLQVLHQLAVTGKRAADVAVLICGQELRVHRIERDEEAIRNLIALERAFWALVQSHTPPPADGSESADRALRALFPHDCGQEVDLSQDFEMSAAFSDLLAVRRVLSEHTHLEDNLKQRIQQRMGDSTRAVFEGGQVTWKRSKDTTSFDLGKCLADTPDLRQRYAVPVAGTRRFVIHPST